MNNTERYIHFLFDTIKIDSTDKLDIVHISSTLNIPIHYWEYSSELTSYKDNHKMFIDENQSKQKQWQDFGHEMYHFFFDEISYNQLNESYGRYGETKADYFAYHFCVPTFMLQQMKGFDVYDVMNLFNVE